MATVRCRRRLRDMDSLVVSGIVRGGHTSCCWNQRTEHHAHQERHPPAPRAASRRTLMGREYGIHLERLAWICRTPSLLRAPKWLDDIERKTVREGEGVEPFNTSNT